MSISLQTNVTSLFAQNALAQNVQGESTAIEQLTSGYRINSSGDDAAGLSVANQYRAEVAELTQGVSNANNGIGVLQTIDGGLNDISQILDRLQTLATQSASATFAGNRATLDNEYQAQLAEITRQATNIGLNTGGSYNQNISVFIGGGTGSNNVVQVNLSGANNAVDATALQLAGTSVAGGGVSLTGNSINLNNTAVNFLVSDSQLFTFNIASATGAATQVTATVSGGTSGLNGTEVVSSLNSQLQASGITASIGSNGELQFSGSAAFTLESVGNVSNGGSPVATATATIPANTENYNVNSAFADLVGTNETLTFQNANGAYNVSLAAGDAAATIQSLNTQLAGSGITAVLGANTTDINIQSSNAFSINQTAAAGTSGGLFATTGAQAVTPPAATTSSTGNATAALTAIANAVSALGLVQGRVGTGENVFNNAINLANSQVTNLSSAESTIRDANVAQAAADLTKAQTLVQSSIAALAQANAIPQAVLKLLQ